MEDLKEINEEISKIRDKIYSSFSNIDFYEDKHEYFVNEKKTNQRVQYSSVSSVIHKYEQPFDKELVAERYALKHGLNKEDVLSEWKYSNLCSTISGTRVHLYGEGYTWLTCGIFDKIPNEVKPQFVQPENWLVPTSPKENGVKKFYDELHPTLIPIGAEFMLSSENLDIKTKMCGTTDLLFYFNHPTDKSKNGVVLSDWKGLPLDTPIATVDGWKTMEDIKEGDMVFDKNGKPTKVLHVSQIHNNPCLKIKFGNNTEIVCDEEHRWELSFFKDNDRNEFEHIVVTAKQIYDSFHNNLIFDKKSKDNSPKVQYVKSIDNLNSDILSKFYEINTVPYTEIIDIKYYYTVPTKCIEVDSETHTYCCGYDMLVTHNTNKDLKKEYARTNNIMMKSPFDYLIDEPLSHYTLQFGCYQLMLESIGINIIGRRLIWIKDNDYELFKISDVTPILKSIL